MKRTMVVGVLVVGLLLPSLSSALADAKFSEKQFCAVSDFFSKNKPLNTTRTTMTYGLTLVGGTLAALVNIEAQRAKMEKGLKSSSTALRALSWAGPLKAFGRAAIPLMDKTAKTIKAVKLDSRAARLYTKVYTPLSYIWMTVNGGMYAVQIAGVGVCKKANIMGVQVTRSGTVSAANKFASLAKRFGGKIKGVVTDLNGLKKIISSNAGTFRKIKSTLQPVKKPLKQLEKGFKIAGKAMKPVFSAANQLVKEMKKRRCITYGVKAKLKMKKGKLKAKVKKVKFCFSIGKVAGKIQKLAKAAQKPVNDIIKKAIKPLMKKVEKGLKKALKVGKLKQFQGKMARIGNQLGGLQVKLNGFKQKMTSAKRLLESAQSSLR